MVVQTLESNSYEHRDVYHFFVIGNSTDDYVKYEINNWFYISYELIFPSLESNDCPESLNITNTRDCLCRINKKNVAIWLSTKGEIQYRLEPYGEIETASKTNASLIISAYCNEPFEIVYTKFKSKSFENANKISIYELLLVEKHKFDPYQPKEFFYKIEKEKSKVLGFEQVKLIRKLAYINSFKPSMYLQLTIDEKFQVSPSIILQYIFYLSNYNKERFNYILNWLASFFKNLQNKSNIILVLIGKKTSGKELFFDEIISPLFGKEYCIKITDYNLDSKNHDLLVKDKIFYNLHNLSTVSIDKKKNQNFLKDLVAEDRIYIENNESILYGQTLITSDDEDIPFLDNISSNYTIFKIPDNIESIYLNDKFIEEMESYTLKELIRCDLKNFCQILKSHSINKSILYKKFESDDKHKIQLSLVDKLNNFHKAIITSSEETLNKISNSNNKLYQEIKADFHENKIKQKNVFLYFLLLYPEEKTISSKALMSYLRNIDNEFYGKDKLLNGKSGLKYFSIN